MSEEYVDEIYDDTVEENPDELLDDDELSPEEAGFLKGYEEAYDDEEEELDKEFE